MNSFKIDPLLSYISSNALNSFPLSDSLERKMKHLQSRHEYLEDKEKITDELFQYLRMILSGLEQQSSSLPDVFGYDKEGGFDLLFKDITCALENDGYFRIVGIDGNIGVPRFQMPHDCDRIVRYLKKFYSLQQLSKISSFQKGKYVKTCVTY
jgi:hypothetical protein